MIDREVRKDGEGSEGRAISVVRMSRGWKVNTKEGK